MTTKRSRDARTQLHVWSKLLEGRMALQKVVTAVRDLSPPDQSDDPTTNRIEPADSATVESITKLLKCLVRLRDTYREKSQFYNENVVTEDFTQLDTDIDNHLLKKHQDYDCVRNDIIEKWCEKTKIGTIPKKGYAALELPTLQLISNAIKDKDRLIKRTQLDRTRHVDSAYHPETFNDDDFYHLLLKEMISKDEDRKWVELQRQRYKNKRMADTRATKGRKIRKDLIPKLVNFMAPSRPANARHRETIPDQIRNELIKSLFGGSVTRSHGQTIDVDD